MVFHILCFFFSPTFTNCTSTLSVNLLLTTCYNSGYDFGYLLKILTCAPMPPDESQFFELLRTYFPCIYDIKYLMKSCKNLKGGLQDIADDLQVRKMNWAVYTHCLPLTDIL